MKNYAVLPRRPPTAYPMPTPAAPQRAHLTANEATAAKKAVRAELNALLKLKRKPFEDLLMDLYSRDQLMTLHRRSLGMKDAKDDWLVRKSKRWTKRKLAGEIYVKLHSCRLSLLQNGVLSIVFGVLAGVGVYGYRNRNRGRNVSAEIYIDTDGNEDVANDRNDMQPVAYISGQGPTTYELSGSEPQSVEYPLSPTPMSYNPTASDRNEDYTQACIDARKNAIVPIICFIVGTAGTGALAHLVTTADHTRYRKHFAKQLRTLRAKRSSAVTRRLTRFVKQFTASKK